MNHKPWPLLILAFIHFIEPVTKITFYSIYFHINPLNAVVNVYQGSSAIQVFEFFFLFPIAGYAIYAVKKWSYPVFIIVEIWVFMINMPYLNELYQTNQMPLLGFFILFGAINLSIVTYLLLPAVRIAYLDPRIRWWEAKPRYSVNIDCKVNNKTAGTIKNISASGVFITTETNFIINSSVELAFQFTAPSIDFYIKSKAIVLHKFVINDIEGYGARFVDLSKDNKRQINKIIKYLDKSNTKRRPVHRNATDLIQWLTDVIKTGKGFTSTTN